MTNYQKIEKAIIRAGFELKDFIIYSERNYNKILHRKYTVDRTHAESLCHAITLFPIEGVKKMASFLKDRI